MAPHSSTLAWKIPWAEEPGRLQSMRSQRVGHDWATLLSLFIFMHWRRKWQPTPVFLPGESQGRGSLVGCRLWGHTESDMTEVTWQHPPFPFGNHKFVFYVCSTNKFIHTFLDSTYNWYIWYLSFSGHLTWRANLPEKTLMLGKIEGRRRRGQQRMR